MSPFELAVDPLCLLFQESEEEFYVPWRKGDAVAPHIEVADLNILGEQKDTFQKDSHFNKYEDDDEIDLIDFSTLDDDPVTQTQWAFKPQEKKPLSEFNPQETKTQFEFNPQFHFNPDATSALIIASSEMVEIDLGYSEDSRYSEVFVTSKLNKHHFTLRCIT